jgi:hypothetical protein
MVIADGQGKTAAIGHSGALFGADQRGDLALAESVLGFDRHIAPGWPARSRQTALATQQLLIVVGLVRIIKESWRCFIALLDVRKSGFWTIQDSGGYALMLSA